MNTRLPLTLIAIANLNSGCTSTRPPAPEVAPNAAAAETPESRPWLERQVVNLLVSYDEGSVYVINGGRAAHISVGDRVVWQDFTPTGKVVEVFDFRARVYLPRPDNTSPKVKERVRVWLNGAEPEPWPAR